MMPDAAQAAARIVTELFGQGCCPIEAQQWLESELRRYTAEVLWEAAKHMEEQIYDANHPAVTILETLADQMEAKRG